MTINFNNLNINYSVIETGSIQHRRAWESGQIDYQGRDSFLNIQQQLELRFLPNKNIEIFNQNLQSTSNDFETNSLLNNSRNQNENQIKKLKDLNDQRNSILKTNLSSNYFENEQIINKNDPLVK